MRFTLGNLAIIPARGGSKRIPGKNTKDFLGKPIIAYSIETALKSGLFDEVMVSTDDPKIAEIAKQAGASIPFLRSAANSDDYATTMDVIHEVVSAYEKLGKQFDLVCCIYPTAPLVSVSKLQEGKALMSKLDVDTVFPIVAFSSPIWRGLKINSDGSGEMVWKEHANTRSQDLESIYHDAGQWYWINHKNNVHSILGSRMGNVILSELEVQDIDNETDWHMAELKYKRLYLNQ